MSLLFVVAAIFVAVSGIMFLCTREPYEGVELYSRFEGGIENDQEQK